MRVALIIGCHPCWKEDYEAASLIYPEHKICAVNFATELTKCDYVCTVHGRLMPDFMKAYKHDNDPIRIQRDNNQTNPDDMKLELGSHGGSAPFAAAAMIHLGFDLAILCGCPMDGAGGYANESRVVNHDVSIWTNAKHGRVNGWCDRMTKFKQQKPEMAAKIKSMSGKTKEIFGGIDG